MRINLIFILSILLITNLISQNNDFQVKDKLDGNVVSYAVVSFYDLDSLFIEGVVSDSLGAVDMTKVSRLSVIDHAMVSSVGYHDYYCGLKKITGERVIFLEPKSEVLEEISINAKKIKRRLKGSSLEIDLSSLVLDETDNITDLLQVTPGVSVGEGGVSVLGDTKVGLLINGVLAATGGEVSEILESIYAEDVKGISIDYSPGSEYDAQSIGKLISLEIETPDNMSIHSIRHKSKYNANAYTPSFGYSLRNNNSLFDTYLLLSYDSENTYTNSTRILERFIVPKINTEEIIENDDTERRGSGLIHVYKRMDKVSLGIQSSYSKSSTNTDIFSDFKDNSQFKVNSTTESKTDNNTLYVFPYIKYKLSENIDFNLEGTYTNKTSKNIVDIPLKITQDGLVENYAFMSENEVSIDNRRVAFDTDFGVSEKTSLTIGGSLSKGLISNIQDVSEVIDRTPTQSFIGSETDFMEESKAAFFSLNSAIKKVNMSIGLRYEFYEYFLDSEVLDSSSIIESFFPNLSLSLDLSERISYNMGYKKSINRPSYQELDPTTYYSSYNAFSVGSFTVKPSITHQLFASFLLDYTYSFMLFRRSENDQINQVFQLGTDGDFKAVFANIKNSTETGAQFSFPYQFNSRFGIYQQLEYKYQELDVSTVENPLVNLLSTSTFNSFTSLDYVLSERKGVNLNISMFYHAPFRQGPLKIGKIYSVNGSLNFSIRKINVDIFVDDVLNSTNPNIESTEVMQSININQTGKTRTFGITLTRRFGSRAETESKDTDSIEILNRVEAN